MVFNTSDVSQLVIEIGNQLFQLLNLVGFLENRFVNHKVFSANFFLHK